MYNVHVLRNMCIQETSVPEAICGLTVNLSICMHDQHISTLTAACTYYLRIWFQGMHATTGWPNNYNIIDLCASLLLWTTYTCKYACQVTHAHILDPV